MNHTPGDGALDVADSIKPLVPAGDDPIAASAVLNDVLTSTIRLHDELQGIVRRHGDDAPGSAMHVVGLTGLLAGTVLDWVGRWPT